MPITTSAACGRPVQQAGLTLTTRGGADLVDGDEADLGELAHVVGAGGLADARAVGQVADPHRARRAPSRRRAAAGPGSGRTRWRTTRRTSRPASASRRGADRSGRVVAAAVGVRRRTGRARAVRHGPPYIDADRWLHSSMSVDMVNHRTIDRTSRRRHDHPPIPDLPTRHRRRRPDRPRRRRPRPVARAADRRPRGRRQAGAAVREWGHVRLFSAWSELVDPAAETLLAATGWQRPTRDLPTGASGSSDYLAPLADALDATDEVEVRYGHRVVGVAKQGRDRLVDSGREDAPFTVHVEHDGVGPDLLAARPSSTPPAPGATPNPLGGDGLPAPARPSTPTASPTASRTSPTRPSGRGTPASASPSPAAAPRPRTRSSASPPSPATHPTPGSSGCCAGRDRRRVRRRRQRPARGPRRPRQARPGGGRAGTVDVVTSFRTAEVAADGDGRLTLDRRLDGRTRRRRRRGHRRHRLPARPELAERGAARPRPGAVAPRRSWRPDRPQRPLLRHRLPARGRRAGPARAGPVSGRA